jgi:hypothetical protein
MSDEVIDFLTQKGNFYSILSRLVGPYYSHNWGVLPSTYEKYETLRAFFDVTGYS